MLVKKPFRILLWLTAAIVAGVCVLQEPLSDSRSTAAVAKDGSKKPAPLQSSKDRRRRVPEIDPDSAEYEALFERIRKAPEVTPEERRTLVADTFAYVGRFKVESIDAVDLLLDLGQAMSKSGDAKLAEEIFTKAADRYEDSASDEFANYADQFRGLTKRVRLMREPFRFAGVLPDSKPFPAADYKNKVVLVEFWATHCSACVEALPKLKNLHAKYHDQGFDIVGICTDGEPGGVAEFLRRHQISWKTSVAGPQDTGNPVATEYAISVTPTLWLLAPDGTVVNFGMPPTPGLEQEIEALLKRRKP